MSGKSSKPEALLKNFWLLPHRATSPGFAKNECKRKTLISRWVKSHFRLFALKRSDCTWFELIGRPVNHTSSFLSIKSQTQHLCVDLVTMSVTLKRSLFMQEVSCLGRRHNNKTWRKYSNILFATWHASIMHARDVICGPLLWLWWADYGPTCELVFGYRHLNFGAYI